MSKIVKLSFLACLILTLSVVTFAQSTVSGAIGGVVTNPNGEVVPGAAVTVVNTGTNKEGTATSDGTGRFRVVDLQPGTYRVSVNATGFGPFSQDAVIVEVGQVTSIEVPLAIGAVSGTVEITSEAPVINTSQQDFSSNINQTSINELPINGRRWSNFALLTPGSTADGNFGLISFRGISGLLNNNTIDGGDNNQAFFSEERGRTRISYVVSQAAIREFQVNTSNYSAEYGRAAGGVVNAVTKSGTNEFHGDLFYYQRNNRLGARNPLATQTVISNGVPDIIGIKPEDVRHQFGGAVGGPIVKNKLFFFFSYDEQKRNFPGIAIFSRADFLTNPATAPNRTALTARGLTNAQIDTAVAFLVSETGEVSRRGDQRLFLPKIDWHINDKNVFTATYNRLRWASPNGIQTQPTNTRGRDSFGDDFVEVDSLTLRLQSTLTSTVLNEARFQYGRDNEFQFSTPPIEGAPATSNGRTPNVFITNGLEFGKPTFLERPAFPDEKRWQYADTVSISRGRHTFKFGGDINYVKDTLNNLRFEGGAYSYNNINDFIIDYTNFRFGLPGTVNCVANTTRFRGKCYTSNYQQGFGNPANELSTTDFNFFFQDDWRVTPRLTLNLGMRYEYERLPDAQIPNPALPQTAQLPDDKNNFGPRFGFAYDIGGEGKTSLRGGYGIYYGRIINSTISNALTNTGLSGVGQSQVSFAPTSASAPVFPNVLASAPVGAGAVQFFSSNFANPQIHQADLILERQISRNTVISASYLLSLGRRLPTFVDTNLPFPTRTRTFTVVGGPFGGQSFTIPVFLNAANQLVRPNPAFGALTEIRSNIKSEYNALVLQANRRLTDGLQFQTSYTLAKATDTGQSSTTFTRTNEPFNTFDLSSERSTSNFDTRHKFVSSVIWNPRFFADGSDSVGRAIFNGFTIAPVVSFYSGRPFNGNISGSGGGAGSLNASGGSNRFPLASRNAFREPRIVNVDLRVSRRFRFSESMNVEALIEGFNIFNRTQVTQLNGTFYNLNNTTSTLTFNNNFGSITAAGGTLFRERQVQFAFRFQF
jgi:hypothetical protein